MNSKLLLFFVILLLFSACEKDETFSNDPQAQLRFSTDSVLFDTLFTSVGSVNRRLKIYNPNEGAILINKIGLSGAQSSAYSLNINGQAGNESEQIKLNGRDSINIFIKVTINPNNQQLPFLVNDTLNISYLGKRQAIPLMAYGQNARFIRQTSISSDTEWNNELPYVVYQSLTVEEGATLRIGAGSQIRFHSNATLNIKGSLIVAGQAGDSVLFSSDRLEPLYAEEPGQWNGLHFYPQSKNNRIQYALIQNAVAGITADSLGQNGAPKLLLSNTTLKNMTVVGFIGYNSALTAFNNLFYRCGQYLLYVAGGGQYNLKQNTFAGYNPNIARSSPSLYFSNAIGSQQSAPLDLILQNNIIWGNLADELSIEKKGNDRPFTTDIQNNLIRSRNSLYTTGNNILNLNPAFLQPENGNFKLAKDSPARRKGLDLQKDPYFKTFLSHDKNNNERLFPSDLGCYENL